MKIRVGGKYLMKSYPGSYLYVRILGMEKDLELDDGKSYYNDKQNGIDQYYGVIIYEHGRGPDLLCWGEDGSWDGAFLDDKNALVEEIQ